MISQKPMIRATRKEGLRFNLGYHLRDYHSAVKYRESADDIARYAGYILKRLDQLGGLAARW
jgi:hypothetical protein